MVVKYKSRMPENSQTIPDYDDQLVGFHEAFEPELITYLKALPLKPGMKVLDFACGDGFYAHRIAAMLGPESSVTGVDINEAYIEKARRGGKSAKFVVAAFNELPFADETFDFVWCAQSFFSLPEPVAVLKQIHRILKPNGLVGILENDSLHQISLPWPIRLEIPLREAELRSFMDESRHVSKFYVGRRLPSVLASGGFDPIAFTTQTIDRRAPLGEMETLLLKSYLKNLSEQVKPYLEPSLYEALKELTDPSSSKSLLKDKFLTMTWMNVLALGKK